MKKILVADDEDILRMLIVDTLEDLGFEIEEAEDGQEALEKLEEGNFDLAILDYMMPEKTGLEVIQSLSKETKNNIQLVMLTAKAQEQDRQIALNAGADYFIAKPFSPTELSAVVEEILA
ncbi:response regulator [Salipaludibacillus neizhouensis]|uniref:Response regulator n=1 Tax=Salipaludibacillus neizhouensis TaxID=885475 RepID=A0A3A9KBK3_9BACI|nr:response regulator [Salipaludibacillus neizhouensis]RKL67912.1 response regulator [Salipaludibacillus neizhouensis]